MVSYYPPKKSPLLAALIGIIPGMGHIYNEQVGKGVFLFSLCLGIFAVVILSVTGVQFLSFASPEFYHGSLFGHTDIQPAVMSKLFVVLSFFVFLPVLVIFSMADAATTAVKINRGEIPLGGYPAVATPPPPPHSPQGQAGTSYQEAMNMKPSQTMGAGSGFAEGASGTAGTGDAAKASFQTEDPPAHASHGSKHGRLVLGLILIAFGFFFMVEDLRIPFLEFDNLWPLIPLFFGLRLLREYQLERQHSQKVLGVIFTVFGGVFLIHNWTNIDVFAIFGDYWYVIPLIIGVCLLVFDFREKQLKKTASNGEKKS